MKFLLLLSLIFIVGCECKPEVKYIAPVISGKDNVRVDFTSQESLVKFTNYLNSRFIPYTIDPKYPNLVSWQPYNRDHLELVKREAFDIPRYQTHKTYQSKEEAAELLSVISELNVEHATTENETGFVVIYTPESEKQKNEIEQLLRNILNSQNNE